MAQAAAVYAAVAAAMVALAAGQPSDAPTTTTLSADDAKIAQMEAFTVEMCPQLCVSGQGRCKQIMDDGSPGAMCTEPVDEDGAVFEAMEFRGNQYTIRGSERLEWGVGPSLRNLTWEDCPVSDDGRDFVYCQTERESARARLCPMSCTTGQGRCKSQQAHIPLDGSVDCKEPGGGQEPAGTVPGMCPSTHVFCEDEVVIFCPPGNSWNETLRDCQRDGSGIESLRGNINLRVFDGKKVMVQHGDEIPVEIAHTVHIDAVHDRLRAHNLTMGELRDDLVFERQAMRDDLANLQRDITDMIELVAQGVVGLRVAVGSQLEDERDRLEGEIATDAESADADIAALDDLRVGLQQGSAQLALQINAQISTVEHLENALEDDFGTALAGSRSTMENHLTEERDWVRACGAEGKLSAGGGSCEFATDDVCPDISGWSAQIANGQLRGDDRSHVIGSIETVECDQGYRPSVAALQCQPDGQWAYTADGVAYLASAADLQCTRIRCPNPPAIEGGFPIGCGGKFAGQSCRVGCNSVEIIPFPNANVECDWEGRWQHDLPHCRKSVARLEDQQTAAISTMAAQMAASVVAQERRIEALVGAEGNNREAGDNAVRALLSTETAAAGAADDDISRRIDDETAARERGDDDVRGRIAREDDARTGALNSKHGQVVGLARNDIAAGMNGVRNLLDNLRRDITACANAGRTRGTNGQCIQASPPDMSNVDTCAGVPSISGGDTGDCANTARGGYCRVACTGNRRAPFPSDLIKCGTNGRWPSPQTLPVCRFSNAMESAIIISASGRMNDAQAKRRGMTADYPAAGCYDVDDFRPYGDQYRGLAWIRLDQAGLIRRFYCDNSQDRSSDSPNGRSGWTYVVNIRSNSQDHSYVGESGRVFPLVPRMSSRPGGWPEKRETQEAGKYSDMVIQKLMNPPPSKACPAGGSPFKKLGWATIRFRCAERVSYYKGCMWRATRSLRIPNACAAGWRDSRARSIQCKVISDTGSTGLGQHSGSSQAMSYGYHTADADNRDTQDNCRYIVGCYDFIRANQRSTLWAGRAVGRWNGCSLRRGGGRHYNQDGQVWVR